MTSWVLVLFLGLQYIDSADFTWAARQVGKDTIVSVSFPSEAINEQVCVYMHAPDTDDIVAQHCWAPRSKVADFDIWENWIKDNYYITASLRERLPDGTTRDSVAIPKQVGG